MYHAGYSHNHFTVAIPISPLILPVSYLFPPKKLTPIPLFLTLPAFSNEAVIFLFFFISHLRVHDLQQERNAMMEMLTKPGVALVRGWTQKKKGGGGYADFVCVLDDESRNGIGV